MVVNVLLRITASALPYIAEWPASVLVLVLLVVVVAIGFNCGWFVQLQSWGLAEILVCNEEVPGSQEPRNAETRVVYQSLEHPTLN